MAIGIMENARLVYTTENGRVCPQCAKPKKNAAVEKVNPAPCHRPRAIRMMVSSGFGER